MTVSTVSVTRREEQEKQIARFIKFSLVGSAVVHLAALAFVMPFMYLKSDGTEDLIEFIVLEESTLAPEESIQESEALDSPTPEAMEELTPEPMPEAQGVESVIPEPMEELTAEPIPEAQGVESATPEPMEELTAEAQGVESATPEPMPEESESLEEWQETPLAEAPATMESPTSELKTGPLPPQKPLEPLANPAPLPSEDPFTNASPLDPGHSSRIANSNSIQRNEMLTESSNLGRLPDPPEVRTIRARRALPSEFEEESPFDPGAIASGESGDPFESNLDRLSEPLDKGDGTAEGNYGASPRFEEDSNLGMSGDLGNESGEDAIACRSCDRPPLPQIALDNAWDGTVILTADIAPNGTVIEAIIQQSSGYDILDYAAQNQVLTWQFDPSENGQQGRVILVTFER